MVHKVQTCTLVMLELPAWYQTAERHCDFFLRVRVNNGLGFIRRTKTHLQMSANSAQYLLDVLTNHIHFVR